MISFPILEHLDVSGYGLFPGSNSTIRGLHVKFEPGLTLVLGANGLGKSTIVAILYRLLTGPFEIPGLLGSAQLGTMQIKPTKLPFSARSTFADRVRDHARDAHARLDFRIGEHRVVVERMLSDLSLTHFSIDGKELSTESEDNFQTEIPRLVGVWSFGDWILVLQYLVFYRENRRALVWDTSAQRQLMRLLFLPAAQARQWAEDERGILETDSRMRNMRAVLRREERTVARAERQHSEGVDVLRELQTLEPLQRSAREEVERLEAASSDIETVRENARLRRLQAEQTRESRLREVERAKLIAIGARLPTQSETARYILAQLLAEDFCLVCQHHVPEAAAKYSRRIDRGECVICESDLSTAADVIPNNEVADKRVARLMKDLDGIHQQFTAATEAFEVAEHEYQGYVDQIQKLYVEIANRTLRINSLIKRLPPAEAATHRQRDGLASLRRTVESLTRELKTQRHDFGQFVVQLVRNIAKKREEIKEEFHKYARGFLFEECRFVWSPQRERVGQEGEAIEFPAFALEMAGADFEQPVRRDGPGQVSESQREFIDLAFRMALVSVAGTGGIGSLVIDAPESSLDTVFAKRAAEVLARFGEPSVGNRLVVTSNLVEGHLIPSLLKVVTMADASAARLVDLFEIAEPTAAVRELQADYAQLKSKMLGEMA